MIRINLLAVERKPKGPSGLDLVRNPLWLVLLLVVATAAGLGWRFVSLQQMSTGLDRDIQQARQEAESLRAVLEKVEQAEVRRQQLQQRVALIEELRRSQSGPVRLLDELSRSLPDRLWLTQLLQEAGGVVKIDGRTTSLTALSDFVGNLEQSGYFARPVEIIDSQVETDRAVGELVKFTVRARFAPPADAPAAVPTTQGAN